MKIIALRSLVVVGLSLYFVRPAHAVLPPPDGGYPGDNTAEGDSALFSLTTGLANTALGASALYSLTTGLGNTAAGHIALYSTTTGISNTAFGSQALRDNTADNNTAVGGAALSDNTTGLNNTAVGDVALTANTTGFNNTATGANALLANTTGSENTGTGNDVLGTNSTGSQNTASGAEALALNTTGSLNAATGYAALTNNVTGSRNTAVGYTALLDNTGGNRNTAIGSFSLLANTTGNYNTALGWASLCADTTGSHNIALGDGAGESLTTGNGNIDIGNSGVAAEARTIRIGSEGTQAAAYFAGISGVTVAGGVGVVVDRSGHLGTVTSSARYKDDIQPMQQASEAILSLQPVTFRYKKELDSLGIPQFGLVAEQVAKVDPDLVARDEQGQPYTVRYEAVNAMLLNEFLKEHRKVEEQGAMIAAQQKQIQTLMTGLQKVNDQLAVTKPAPRVVTNE